MIPALSQSSRGRTAHVIEHRMMRLALALSTFAYLPRRAEVQPLRSRSHRRCAAQLSEHPALPFSLKTGKDSKRTNRHTGTR